MVHVLRTLLLRIDVSELQFTPDTGPPYGEYVTGKQFRELTDEVHAELPFVSPLTHKRCVPLVVMYSSDKMVAGELHKTTFHPGYIALLNQKGNSRYKPESVSMVCSMPKWPTKALRRTDKHVWASLRTYMHCTAILFDPVRQVSKTGIHFKLKDGSIIWVKIYIGQLNTDNEEQDDLATLRRGAT